MRRDKGNTFKNGYRTIISGCRFNFRSRSRRIVRSLCRRNSGIGFKKFIAVNLTHNPIRIVHGFTESTEKKLETCPVRKFQSD